MISARGFSACLAAALVWVSVGANATAGIVFGNLGATGNGSLGTTNTDIGSQDPSDVNWLAQGFNTGSSSELYLNSVDLGLYGTASGSLPLTVSIFSSVSNAPGSLLYTSASTNVGNVGKYSFSFSGVQLQPNTGYFVVPHGGSWYWNSPPSAPVGQNSSGYTYTATYESLATTTSPSGPWTSPAGSNRYSLSVSSSSAVPEIDPSGVASALAVVAGAFSLLERRRVKAIIASTRV
jgi:hypothetical protein